MLENITKGVIRTTLPKLPPLQGFAGYEEYMTQVRLWKNWIQWEKDDPLMVKDEKREVYNQRVIYLYKQALMALRYWPELWYEAAEWCFDNDLENQGNEFLAQGIEANPESCLLAFRQAHQIELKGEFEDGDSGIRKGEAVRAPFDKVLSELYDLTNKMKKREEQSIARIKETFAAQQSADEAARANARRDDDDDEDEEAENARRQKEKEDALQTQIQNISAGYDAQIKTLKKTISYAWIALMRSMRRIQGKGSPGGSPPGFRGIFAEARKKGKLASDVYVASALIEHHCYQDPAATKIFDRGMRLFPDDEHFALEYIKHLVKQNDLTSEYIRSIAGSALTFCRRSCSVRDRGQSANPEAGVHCALKATLHLLPRVRISVWRSCSDREAGEAHE
jgi:cleavage stimulation factor subunit 3